jgi:demethylmenaquinone methyltransferase/2-methoxy-6-polyprenyl-1,4-benzoquinol methylase
VPRIGGWLSDRNAYAYLPRSTAYLPGARVFGQLLMDKGFGAVKREPLLLGTAQIVTAVRGEHAP